MPLNDEVIAQAKAILDKAVATGNLDFHRDTQVIAILLQFALEKLAEHEDTLEGLNGTTFANMRHTLRRLTEPSNAI